MEILIDIASYAHMKIYIYIYINTSKHIAVLIKKYLRAYGYIDMDRKMQFFLAGGGSLGIYPARIYLIRCIQIYVYVYTVYIYIHK